MEIVGLNAVICGAEAKETCATSVLGKKVYFKAQLAYLFVLVPADFDNIHIQGHFGTLDVLGELVLVLDKHSLLIS